MLIIGILPIGLVGAGLTGLIPKDETINSNLAPNIKNRLDNDITNVKWNKDIVFIDDKIIQGELCYEINKTVKCVKRTLSMNHYKDRYVCLVENVTEICEGEGKEQMCYNIIGDCLEFGYSDLEEFIKDRMVVQSDKVMMYRYKEFEDTQPDKDVVDVGEKTVNLML